MRKYVATLAVLVLTVVAGRFALSHCEIPCGIYDDPVRITLIKEHTKTIEKSMKQITALSQADKPNPNQLARWVGNKEKHADEIQHIVAQYWMTQRVKPADEGDAAAYKKYVTQITLLHQMLQAAMKAKQTTELEHVAKLRALVEKFEAVYFGK